MEKVVNMNQEKVLILGGGPAGLAVSYFLHKKGIDSLILEKQENSGGLCKSFSKEGFFFDYGGHASFTRNRDVMEILEKDVEIQKCTSAAINYYQGIWIKNPAQNNLYNLSTDEKIKVIKDFVIKQDTGNYKNYKEWLISKYGKYFAENFPCRYTRKYWTIDAEDMGTEWIGQRMYTPTLEEVLYGAFELNTASVHYSGEIRYPITGGYEQFLKKLKSSSNVRCDAEITLINCKEKYVVINNKEKLYYNRLVYTLPLDKTHKIFANVPEDVKKAAAGLKHTSFALVSLGIKGEINVPESFYVYDEDFIITRGFSTSRFGYGNAPEGMNTLQLEVNYSEFKPLAMSGQELLQKVIDECDRMGCLKKQDIIVTDVCFCEYANVIFNHDIYKNREKVQNFLSQNEIIYTGRFADWDYLWVDQTILSAQRAAEKLIRQMN